MKLVKPDAALDLAEECLEFISIHTNIEDSEEAYDWLAEMEARAKELRMQEVLRDPVTEEWNDIQTN